ncbi:hypothetical protein [Methylobacter sp.]|uniref:hypothetical protein n=1 Tax=Methylobacter sp. TaxID=2051955 RepID=UPI00248A63B1|nr:hypothetical protein [Methylobacter sp.]MDI1278056.1 hypothetical protein [Methylobacter sp.]
MSSYQLLAKLLEPEVRRQIIQAAAKLDYLGLVLLKVEFGRGSVKMIVYPTKSTQLLRSTYTGQGWEDGHFYKSYAAIIDGVTIVWRKPMQPLVADSKIVEFASHRRALQ